MYSRSSPLHTRICFRSTSKSSLCFSQIWFSVPFLFHQTVNCLLIQKRQLHNPTILNSEGPDCWQLQIVYFCFEVCTETIILQCMGFHVWFIHRIRHQLRISKYCGWKRFPLEYFGVRWWLGLSFFRRTWLFLVFPLFRFVDFGFPVLIGRVGFFRMTFADIWDTYFLN